MAIADNWNKDQFKPAVKLCCTQKYLLLTYNKKNLAPQKYILPTNP